MQSTSEKESPRPEAAIPTENTELKLALDFIQHTDKSVFLTGRAGTGKTTLLKTLKALNPKRMIVTAPTGVAAINAGGVTLHSFFQLPFGPFIPGAHIGKPVLQRQFKKEKRKLIKSLELLIIDEISMVRSDLLDGVDAVLRRFKDRSRPFGGLQLLMIGDLHQLSPIVRPEEWDLLKEHYDSVFFFDSHALQQTQKVTIELKHIYRQSDPRFIALLNRVRNNKMAQKDIDVLNTRYRAHIPDDERKNDVTLCTHNDRADKINQENMASLTSEPYIFEAKTSKGYPTPYPVDPLLVLKRYAQVMFVRNDPSGEKRYFNGKVGRITQLSKYQIIVKCLRDAESIVVEKLTWESLKYTLDQETQKISEEVVGTFHQYPLRLAWAITIHKSQGLTFDRAIVDANRAFAHGQVYVALSRCKSFEGLSLSQPFRAGAIKTDKSVVQYAKRYEENPSTQDDLKQAKVSYQQKQLLECFDFQELKTHFIDLAQLLIEQQGAIGFPGMDALPNLEKKVLHDLASVSEQFKSQLHELYDDDTLPDDDSHLQERVKKASCYFRETLQGELSVWVTSGVFESDNKAIETQIYEAFERLARSIFLKRACMACCQDGFSVSRYQETVATAELKFDSAKARHKGPNQEPAKRMEHEVLFQSLADWRNEKSEEAGIAQFNMLYRKGLIQITLLLPRSIDALRQIKGVGPRLIKKYGAELVALVRDYCQKNNIALDEPESEPKEGLSKDAAITPPKKARAPEVNTKQISFDLYSAGKSIAKIAEERGLLQVTIEGHLAHYIGLGKLKVTQFLNPEKIAELTKWIEKHGKNDTAAIKKTVGDAYSHGEIQMVIEHLKHPQAPEEPSGLFAKIIRNIKHLLGGA